MTVFVIVFTLLLVDIFSVENLLFASNRELYSLDAKMASINV